MFTKIIYLTVYGETFKTIAWIDCNEVAVKKFMSYNFNMDCITSYSFRPTVKTSYNPANIRVK